MIKEMNKHIFARHLELVINEIKQKENLQFNNEMFSIMPIVEQGKLLTGDDEMMRLNILNKSRVNNKLFTKDDVVSMLTFYSPFVPLWIDVEHISTNSDDSLVFLLKCSIRLRKPSQLWNQESGHPPFRAVFFRDN